VVPILSKILLGFLIPRFNRDVPDDFPYNPYWRDFLVTSISMVCRGEFNFVVAAVALRAQLITPTAYAAIVLAVLLSSIIGPLILSRIIRYYNKKSLEYIEISHPIQRIGDTCDGYRPLFLAVQARTPGKIISRCFFYYMISSSTIKQVELTHVMPPIQCAGECTIKLNKVWRMQDL
jgi:hypothetical protein